MKFLLNTNKLLGNSTLGAQREPIGRHLKNEHVGWDKKCEGSHGTSQGCSWGSNQKVGRRVLGEAMQQAGAHTHPPSGCRHTHTAVGCIPVTQHNTPCISHCHAATPSRWSTTLVTVTTVIWWDMHMMQLGAFLQHNTTHLASVTATQPPLPAGAPHSQLPLRSGATCSPCAGQRGSEGGMPFFPPDIPPYQPPRSPDLSPLDFYLWGHLKAPVYATPVDDVGTLHNRIVVGCETIRNFPGIHQRPCNGGLMHVFVLMEGILNISFSVDKRTCEPRMLEGQGWAVTAPPRQRDPRRPAVTSRPALRSLADNPSFAFVAMLSINVLSGNTAVRRTEFVAGNPPATIVELVTYPAGAIADGNIARLALRSDEALGVRVSVVRIAPSLLDLGRAGPSHPQHRGLEK
ncbi:hypothetical protein PR048_007469 [Dryococelus australis]|uniref:Uncharacterized protein n=1 Tax=Dryococelus australis TaxID=614101 RepID=A0ABQ9HUC0_9NEOP|nr:hypothetical protein PR048_007469 [Dryococelus australis]